MWYGPYSLEQINGYLKSGHLLQSDQLLTDNHEWIVLRKIKGVIVPPPAPPTSPRPSISTVDAQPEQLPTQEKKPDTISPFVQKPLSARQTEPDAIDKFFQGTKYPSGKPAPVDEEKLADEVSNVTLDDGWFYVDSGKQVGPYRQDQILSLIRSGRILRNSMVWQEGMSDWQQASLTKLSEVLQGVNTVPPPLYGDEIDNNVIWFLAFAPLVSTFVLNFLSLTMHWNADTANLMVWVLPISLNIGLCLFDEKRLRDAGHDMQGLSSIVCILVPAYLFLRAAKLRQNNAYAWVWLVTFGLSLLIPVKYFLG
jgi:hypothetical protein